MTFLKLGTGVRIGQTRIFCIDVALLILQILVCGIGVGQVLGLGGASRSLVINARLRLKSTNHWGHCTRPEDCKGELNVLTHHGLFGWKGDGMWL